MARQIVILKKKQYMAHHPYILVLASRYILHLCGKYTVLMLSIVRHNILFKIKLISLSYGKQWQQ